VIELGTIPIKNTPAVFEVRNKIRALAQDLKFDTITATRMATMTSELSRRMVSASQMSDIKIVLDKRNGAFGLVLLFTSGLHAETFNVKLLTTVFDDVEVVNIGRVLELIVVFKSLPDAESEPDQTLVDKIRQVVQPLTSEELMAQLEARAVEIEKTNINLEEASRHKSQFLASMSHELRTPLNSIIGYTKLILDGMEGEINDEQQEDLSIIYNNSQHLLRLINDLLDKSKIEAGKVVLNYESFTLSKLLDNVIPGIKQLASAKGLVLISSVDSENDNVYADPVKTRQILTNILGNAIKFTEEGSITLKITGAPAEFIFSVQDTGIGIRKEELKVIFDSFKQVGPANIAGFEGTGLGLAISKALIELHGGRIWASSEPGKGSTFNFTLPRNAAEQ
jgi:signal transduction histidine kinase